MPPSYCRAGDSITASDLWLTRPASRLGAHSELLHLLVEVAALQAQPSGGLGHVAARFLQRRLDLLALELLDGLAEPPASRARERLRRQRLAHGPDADRPGGRGDPEWLE